VKFCLASAALLPLASCASASAGRRERLTPRVERAIRDSVTRVISEAVADSAFPGAFAAVGSRDRVWFSRGFGQLDLVPGSPQPDDRTLWDLASLTKVVGLTTAMMQLVAEGKVVLDSPVFEYLPRFTGEGKQAVTVRQLLTHSSGLPAWRPLYKEAASPDEALAVVYATPLDTAPGTRMVYSDLGAILLGQIVEEVGGWPLDQYLASHVFGPLEMLDTGFRPARSQWFRCAPTEWDPWRQRHIRGEVHDENAFALGGVAGHAGLFSTGRDLIIFAQTLMGGGERAGTGVRIVPDSTLRAFTTLQDPELSNRALGWEKPTGGNSGGHLMSSAAFGHTGFTGTSIWIDPERDLFVILLTNRINPTRENHKISAVRTHLADAIIEATTLATSAVSVASGN
jgi:CubicO group peptidase (beta-lactamase class C family)